MVQELQGMGWSLLETEGNVYSFNKECAGDIDVIVSVRKIDSGYDVFSSSEHRCSGPSETIVATATTIEEALNKMMVCCANWDKIGDAEVDLSMWWSRSKPSGRLEQEN